MIRRLLLAFGLAAGGAGVAWADCRTVAITAAGRPVVGIEDLVLDEEEGRVLLSAYDRRADPERAGGGLFAVPLAALAGDHAADRAEAVELSAGFRPAGGFRPHGIDLRVEADGRRSILAINRRTGGGTAINRRTGGGTAVERFTLGGTALRPVLRHEGTVEDPLLCRANDLAFLDGDRFLFTADHGGCGWAAVALENVLGLRRGFVGLVEGGRARAVAGGIGFPNGLLPDPAADRLYVAATRERAVLAYRLSGLFDGSATAPVGRIPVPGGPDNLSRAPAGSAWSGRILAAVHPSLFALALHRYGLPGGGTAPARVVALDGGAAEVLPADLLVDEDGRRFSAATVAAAWGDRLIAGSVMSDRLLVCGAVPNDAVPSDAGRSSGSAARSAPTPP